MAKALSPDELPELAALTDWCVQPGQLCARFRATSFGAAARFVVVVAAAADEADHHPDIDLRFPGIVQIVLTSHDAGGLTRRDTRLGAHISALAAQSGLSAEPEQSQAATLLVEVADPDEVSPFWQAALGYRQRSIVAGEHHLVDSRRFNPDVVLARRAPATTGDTVRLQLAVTYRCALQRVDAALGAGGSVLAADAEHGRWLLADAVGNEVLLTSWPGPSSEGA